MDTRVPLTTLLSQVWIAHAIAVDNAFEAASAERAGRTVRISLAMWTNGLRFVHEDGVKVSELQARAGAVCNLGGLERWGWISVGEVTGARREGYGSLRGVKGDTVLRPTRAGSYARRLWPRVIDEVETVWVTRFGGDTIKTLREALPAVAAPLPWSPPEVAPSDGFLTHIVHDGLVQGAVTEFADSARPLAALLGQVLTAFTLEHERTSKVSLPLAADLLRVLGSGAVRMRDLPALSGISKEGIAMAVSYTERTRLTTSEGRIVSLTPRGRLALDDYRHIATQPTSDALRDALTGILERPTTLAACLAPPPGCWRGANPYLAQTRRVLADPAGALPWHPMVLHRAGWPDGS